MILNYLLKHQMLFDSPPTINNQELSFTNLHQIPRMLIKQNILLLNIRHMGINFCCANGAMPQHALNIPDIHILLQKQGGKGMAEHMWCQMLLNPGKFGITCNHKTDGLIR